MVYIYNFTFYIYYKHRTHGEESKNYIIL